MSDRPVRIPGPDHTIDIEPTRRRVVVSFGGRVIADSDEALTLDEAGYAPAYYVPRKHADMSALVRSDTSSYCPYKGDAAYFSIETGSARSADAIWTYEHPFEAVDAIREYLAFYPDRVDAIEVTEKA